MNRSKLGQYRGLFTAKYDNNITKLNYLESLYYKMLKKEKEKQISLRKALKLDSVSKTKNILYVQTGSLEATLITF